MTLSVRPTPYIIPSYSLTGDLLAYLRCGLQYRYHHRGALPPSKPVQLWFGEFIHGVMEEAYRQWGSSPRPFSWDDGVLLLIEDLIIRRLGARGIWPRNPAICDLRARRSGGPVDDLAHRRARAAINVWGPHLFPLIAQAEVRLKGIRSMPNTAAGARADYYEVQGIVDVLTSVELAVARADNRLLVALQADQTVSKSLGQVIAQSSGAIGPVCEVIVDYKGMRRPNTGDPTWQYLGWQILTYAWLREQQPGAAPVVGGVLLFLNELEPSRDDMEQLWDEVLGRNAPRTDTVPLGADLAALRAWNPHRRQSAPPALSLEYRIARSIRVVPVTALDKQRSLTEFDRTVTEIEMSVVQERGGRSLTTCWQANSVDQTCAACDFRTYCPSSPRQGAPLAP
jgi:hypothetical protein